VGWLAILFWLLVAPAHASQPAGYQPPELWKGARAGDSYDAVKSQAGWFECGRKPRTQLCRADDGPTGEPEGYAVNFVNGRAYSGTFGVDGVKRFKELYARFQSQQRGNNTILGIETVFLEVDFIKDMHELGVREATLKAIPLVDPKNERALLGITFIAQQLSDRVTYRSSKELLNALPPGLLVFTVYKNEMPDQNLTTVRMKLNPADKKILFPEFCANNCESWDEPETDW